MATDTAMKTGILDRLGDSFTGLVEGSLGFVGRLFGSANDRAVKAVGYVRPKNSVVHTILSGSILERTNAFESQMKAITDDELKGLSIKYRERYKAGETLEDLDGTVDFFGSAIGLRDCDPQLHLLSPLAATR